MIPAVCHPFGILESLVVRPWGRGGVGGSFAALALRLGMGGPRGPRSFTPLLGLLPLSLPHLGCLALALPLRRRSAVEVLIDLPLAEEEVAPDVLEGFGESGALVHHLVNLAPCIALCKKQGGVARGTTTTATTATTTTATTTAATATTAATTPGTCSTAIGPDENPSCCAGGVTRCEPNHTAENGRPRQQPDKPAAGRPGGCDSMHGASSCFQRTWV